MDPEDIESRDFFVGLRGYDRDEVDRFLAEVAADHRAALTELEELRNRPAPPADPFTELGSSVTAILRAAHESAETITAQAQQDADRIRADAETITAQAHQDADVYAEQVRRDADGEAARIRNEATAIVDAARSEAERIVRAAQDDADRMEADAERRGRERAAAAADDAVGRLADANRRHEELRARLAETSDEIQLALMAMGDERTDPAQVIRDAVLATAVDEVVDVTDGADATPHEVEPTAG